MPQPVVNTEVQNTYPVTAVAPNGDEDVLRGRSQINALVTIGENYRCDLDSDLGMNGAGFYAADGRYSVSVSRTGLTHYLLDDGDGLYVWQESGQDTLSYVANYSTEDNSKLMAMVSLESDLGEARLHPLSLVNYVCTPVPSIEEEKFLVPEGIDFQEVEVATDINTELFVN